jgi:F-type H+-transporting ATPase subunit b
MADATSAAAAPSSGGLPQFDPAPWAGEIFWSLVIFLVLYLLISRVFVPRVAGTIEKREDSISQDIGDARRARDAAQADLDVAAAEIASARARAQKVAQDAQAQAKAAAAARKAQEEARLSEVLAAADARIAAARAEAMSHVRTIATETAEAMIARLTSREASRAEVEGALSHLPTA